MIFFNILVCHLCNSTLNKQSLEILSYTSLVTVHMVYFSACALSSIFVGMFGNHEGMITLC